MSTNLSSTLEKFSGSSSAGPVHEIPLWTYLVTSGLLVATVFLDGAISSRMPREGTSFGDFHHLRRSLGYLPT